MLLVDSKFVRRMYYYKVCVVLILFGHGHFRILYKEFQNTFFYRTSILENSM
jgi:hypothetical protein